MNTNNIKHYIPTLTIAGSDCSGGAGIQADIKTMSALGCYAMSVITAITAQNTCGVIAIEHVSCEIIRSQINVIFQDIIPKAVKIGMLSNNKIIRVVGEEIKKLQSKIPIVVDPVMVATSGDKLLQDNAIEQLITEILPLASLLTPNIPETELLTGRTLDSETEFDKAADIILNTGTKAVLIKGGHINSMMATDILYTNTGKKFTFSHEKINSNNTHGTGCTLSSAITSYLACGYDIKESVEKAKKYISLAIISGKNIKVGNGHGPVDHFFNPQKSIKI